MKTFFALFLAVQMTLSLAACGAQEPPAPVDPAPEQSAPAEPAPEAPAEKAVVTAEYASDELLAQTDAYDEVADDTSEYATKVAFTASGAVKDFQYFEIIFVEDEKSADGFRFERGEDLYAADELSPERPLVIGMFFSDVVPVRGFSYTDETGVTKTYSLFMSGKDGSLIVSEFDS